MKLEILFFLASVFLLKTEVTLGLTCMCLSTDGNSNCDPSTGVEKCRKGVDHCILAISNPYHQQLREIFILQCWPWSDETQKCPKDPGRLVIAHFPSDLAMITFCCTGDNCNNVTDFSTLLPANRSMISLEPARTLPRTTITPAPTPKASGGPSYLTIIFIVLGLLVLTVVVLILLCCVYRHKKWAIIQRLYYSGLNSNATARETVDCSSYCPTAHMAEGEIEQIASKCVKIEVRSQGRFGCVWLAHLTPPGKTEVREVAAKIFPLQEERSWEAELEIYRLPCFQHPNILRFLGADKFGEGVTSELWLVSEYHTLGSVYDFLRQRTLTYPELLRVVLGIVRGLSYLHEERPHRGKPGIAHRDFKSKNVLLKADLTPCISDFGLAMKMDAGQCIGEAHLQVGTRRYMAPEVLEGAIQFSRDAFLRIDAYAMALVLWEVMTRTTLGEGPVPEALLPFEEELGAQTTMEQLQMCVAQRKCRPKAQTSWLSHPGMTFLWNTVQECWDADAEARLSAGCVAERMTTLLPSEGLQETPQPMGNGHVESGTLSVRYTNGSAIADEGTVRLLINQSNSNLPV